MFDTSVAQEFTMALAHDPAHIASAVLIAAGDMLFLPAEDSIPARGAMDRASIGRGLVFVADDGVDGVALWTSDGTEAGTRRIGPVRPPADQDTQGRPDTVQRSLSSILDDWRAAERRLASAREAADTAEVTRLGIEVASFADEHRDAFDSVMAQYADRGPMPHARSRVTWSTATES